MIISIHIQVDSMIDILMQNVNQLTERMMILETKIENYIASNDMTLKAIYGTIQSKYENIKELNETMQIMQKNIASNDLTLRAINDTLQYVVKTPMVIIVPSSDEIDNHRSKFSKM